jgi:hypothetical protein
MPEASLPVPDQAQLAARLALQDLDLRLQRLRHRRANLPERATLQKVEAALAALQAEHDTLEAERSRLAAQRDALEGDAGAAGARIATIEDRLRSGAVGSFRDQEAMATEIASLGARRGELEDRELEVMEELEPVERALAALGARHAVLEDERAVAAAAHDRAVGAADAELAAALAERPPLADAVEPGLLRTYEDLAARLGGVAVARVLHGTCDGCRLSLSATELDQLRHGGSGRLRCEQCGRILVSLG